MKFLVDNQLPAALARFLAARGHDAQHVLDLNLEEAGDSELWRLATAQGRAIISKDEDFLHLATRHNAGIALVWVRLPNCRKQALLAAFEQCLPAIISALEAGNGVVEVR